jgi:hypothetical protein
VTRTCLGNHAFCSPFFDLFTPSFPLYETIFSSSGYSNQTYDRGANYVPLFYQEGLKNYAASFAETYDGHEPTFNSQTLMLTYDPSVETVDSFEIDSFAASVVDGNSGKVTLSASSGVYITSANSQGNQKTNVRIDSSTANMYLAGELLDSAGQPHGCCIGSERRKKRDANGQYALFYGGEEDYDSPYMITKILKSDSLQFEERGNFERPVNFSSYVLEGAEGREKEFDFSGNTFKSYSSAKSVVYRFEVSIGTTYRRTIGSKFWFLFLKNGTCVSACGFDMGQNGDGIHDWLTQQEVEERQLPYLVGSGHETTTLFCNSQSVRMRYGEELEFKLSLRQYLNPRHEPVKGDRTTIGGDPFYLLKDVTKIQVLTLARSYWPVAY